MSELLNICLLGVKLWLIGEIVACAFAIVIAVIALVTVIKAFYGK